MCSSLILVATKEPPIPQPQFVLFRSISANCPAGILIVPLNTICTNVKCRSDSLPFAHKRKSFFAIPDDFPGQSKKSPRVYYGWVIVWFPFLTLVFRIASRYSFGMCMANSLLCGNYILDGLVLVCRDDFMKSESSLFSVFSERFLTNLSTSFMIRLPKILSIKSWSESSRILGVDFRFFGV